jgi:hypothetical protein
MRRSRPVTTALVIAALLIMPLMPLGCEDLPGGEKEQGAVIGGVGGAAAGAAIASENRALGALIGGLLGAGGGYLIGSEMEKADGDDQDVEEAREAVQEAQQDPATAAEAQQATTADINNDGFVTLDEVVAMDKAGYSDQEMINRLRQTGQVFELTERQRTYLRNQGVSDQVVEAMQQINREQREELLQNNPPPDNVISQPPNNGTP